MSSAAATAIRRWRCWPRRSGPVSGCGLRMSRWWRTWTRPGCGPGPGPAVRRGRARRAARPAARRAAGPRPRAAGARRAARSGGTAGCGRRARGWTGWRAGSPVSKPRPGRRSPARVSGLPMLWTAWSAPRRCSASCTVRARPAVMMCCPVRACRACCTPWVRAARRRPGWTPRRWPGSWPGRRARRPWSSRGPGRAARCRAGAAPGAVMTGRM